MEAETFGDAWQPNGGRIVAAQWVYTWNSDENSKVVKAKARLVARGSSQWPGVEYHETFTPTPATPCIRLIAAKACELRLDLCHIDIQQAFVQAVLNEVVLTLMPQGNGALYGKLIRLNRSLYGLKQASRSWHSRLVIRPKSLGCGQSLADAPITNHSVGLGFPQPAGRYRPGECGFMSLGSCSCRDMGVFLTRGWGLIRGVRWLSTILSPAAIGQWHWGFYTVRGGFDPEDHRFRPQGVGVVTELKDL